MTMIPHPKTISEQAYLALIDEALQLVGERYGADDYRPQLFDEALHTVLARHGLKSEHLHERVDGAQHKALVERLLEEGYSKDAIAEMLLATSRQPV